MRLLTLPLRDVPQRGVEIRLRRFLGPSILEALEPRPVIGFEGRFLAHTELFQGRLPTGFGAAVAGIYVSAARSPILTGCTGSARHILVAHSPSLPKLTRATSSLGFSSVEPNAYNYVHIRLL